MGAAAACRAFAIAERWMMGRMHGGGAGMKDQPLWISMPADGRAEPVNIVDLDVARTTWSRVHESMRVAHLRLSRQPELQWIKFFHEERESRIGIRRRGLWIEDGYIAFDCLTQEIESHHLPDIRRSVEYANQKYLAFVEARRRERGDGVAAGQAELRELEALRDRLRAVFVPQSARRPAPADAAPTSTSSTASQAGSQPDGPPASQGAVPPTDAATIALHDAAVAAAAAAGATSGSVPSAASGLDDTLAGFRATLRAAQQRRGTDADADSGGGEQK
jgi:hypothetical protein